MSTASRTRGNARTQTTVARIPEHVHLEAKRLAAIRGQQPGEVLTAAWNEYLENHRDEFAADLEQAAAVMRDGTVHDLADFLGRDRSARAEAAFAAGRQQLTK